MKKRGWTMHPQLRLGAIAPSIHLQLLPTNAGKMTEWAADLHAVVAELKANPVESTMATLKAALDGVDLSNLADGDIMALLEIAGLGGGALPDSEAAGDVWEVLDGIEPTTRDRVLTLYYNQLSRYLR
jgi:hypothetical protein